MDEVRATGKGKGKGGNKGKGDGKSGGGKGGSWNQQMWFPPAWEPRVRSRVGQA